MFRTYTIQQADVSHLELQKNNSFTELAHLTEAGRQAAFADITLTELEYEEDNFS